MANTAVFKNEIDKVMDFICETKEGKFTLEKPDLTHIIYSRMEIQDGDVTNIFNDCFEEVVLYGMSY